MVRNLKLKWTYEMADDFRNVDIRIKGYLHNPLMYCSRSTQLGVEGSRGSNSWLVIGSDSVSPRR